MKRTAISTPNAPALLASYSQAVRADNFVFISGIVGVDPATNELKSGIGPQLRQCFQNLQAVAVAAGGSMDHVVKLTMYLTNVDDYIMLSEVMSEFFTAPYPARATVAVAAIPYGAAVEMEGIMLLD